MAEERPPVLVFDGVRFGLELGTSLSLTQKVALKALIERHGGIVDAVFGPKSDCLVVTKDKLTGQVQRVAKAHKLFKPVILDSYICAAVEQGRYVDAEVMELDGFVQPPRSDDSFQEKVVRSESRIEPTIGRAVRIIQRIFAGADEVPRELTDRLKRPVWMTHLSSLFYKSVPDPRHADDDYDEDPESQLTSLKSSGGTFSIEMMRLQREMALRERMDERAKLKEEEERVHFDRLAARRELNKLAEMEEAKYMEQQEEYNELVQQDLNGSIESFPPAPTAAERMARKLQQIDVNEMESALAHFYEDVVEFDSDQDVSYLTMRSRPPQALRAAKSGTLEESSQDPLLASELFGNNAYFRLSLTGKEDLKQNRLAMSDTILEEERIRKEKEKMQRERSDKFLQMGLAPRPRPQYSRRNYYSSYYSYDTDEDEYEDDRRRGGDQKKDNAKPTPPLYPFDEIRMFGFSKYDREEKVAELEIAGDLTGSAKGLSSSEPSGTAKNGKSGGWGKVVKPPSDAGRKVFLGGVKFDDITSASKSEKWPESKMKEIRSLRIAELKALCATFGTISSWEEKWDEGYAFVTYETKDEADRMFRTLSQFDHRKGLCKQIRAKVLEKKLDKRVVPSHSFYVRWPKFYQRIVAKNKAKKAEEKAKEKELKLAREKEATDTVPDDIEPDEFEK